MADHRIRIDLAAEARDAMSNARGGGSSGSPASANAAPASGGIPDIGATLSDLTTAIKELSRNVERQTGEDRKKKPEQDRILTPQQRGAEAYSKIADSIKTGMGKMVPDFVKSSAGAISNAFGMAKGAAGGVIGSMGASIPIAGAMIGAASYLIQKTRDVGEAYIATAGAQKGSAGLGGVQAGGYNYLVGGEMSEFVKQRRIAARRNSEYGDDQVMSTNSANYMRTFGIGGGEMGKTIGMFQSTGNRLGAATDQFAKYGVTTEMQSGIGMITQALADAVTEGVNASDVASDMAQEIGLRTALSGGKSVAFASATYKSLGGIGDSVNKGNTGSFQNFQYYNTAKSMITEQLEAGKGDMLDNLLSSNVLSQETIDNYKKTKTISPYTLAEASQAIAGEKTFQGKIGRAYMRKNIESLGGFGNKDQVAAIMKDLMPEAYGSPQKFALEMMRAEYEMETEKVSKGGKMSSRGLELDAKIKAAEASANKNFLGEQQRDYGAAGIASGLEAQRNVIKLGPASSVAASAVVNFETQMDETMTKVAPLAIDAFRAVNTASTTLAEGMSKATDIIIETVGKLKEMKEKGVTRSIIDSVFN